LIIDTAIAALQRYAACHDATILLLHELRLVLLPSDAFARCHDTAIDASATPLMLTLSMPLLP